MFLQVWAEHPCPADRPSERELACPAPGPLPEPSALPGTPPPSSGFRSHSIPLEDPLHVPTVTISMKVGLSPALRPCQPVASLAYQGTDFCLSWVPPEPHEKSHALQYTKLHCGGPKCRLAFPIISYGITELYLKGSVLTSGDLKAFGQTEAMRTREEERW